jgi:HEAT repeat protein
MKRTSLSAWILAVLLGASQLVTGEEAKSDSTADSTEGTRKIYGNIPNDQIEFLSSPERIINVASSGAPSAIWETLEHGERVECLQCIPAVEPLLYRDDPQTREIAAWWLRRRVFGVFGPGEVYERTLQTLKGDADPKRRAYAAYAIGEFLATPGVEACATALASDADPTVRAAAASALGRLNDDGGGALGRAMSDADPRVKVAAIGAAGKVNTFADVQSVARLVGDGDALVRRRAVELLDRMRAKDAAAAVAQLAKNDPDRNVRVAACHALGSMGDPSVKPILEQVLANDTDQLVKDQARIALKRL